MSDFAIIPEPKTVSFTGQSLPLKKAITRKFIISLEHATQHFPKYIERNLNAFGIKTRFFEVDNLRDQAYKIEISQKGIVIYAGTKTGLKFGFKTLLQVLAHCSTSIPCCVIEDEPEYEFRAFHLDLRMRTYKPAFLKELFDNLSALKYSAVVVEYEDSFPYHNEPCIPGPIYYTADQIKDLNKFAQRYGIEIIPYLSVYSKLDYVLGLERYAGLAAPADADSLTCSAHIDCRNAQALRLVCSMIDELKAAHNSSAIFIDCNDHRQGQNQPPSAPALEEYASAVIAHAAKRSVTPIVWADLPFSSPALLTALPASTIMVVRENQLQKDKTAQLKTCKDAGFKTIVELSLVNQSDNEFTWDAEHAVQNIIAAGKPGKSNGALVSACPGTETASAVLTGRPVCRMVGERRMHVDTLWFALGFAAEYFWNSKNAFLEGFQANWPRFWFDCDDQHLVEMQTLLTDGINNDDTLISLMRNRKKVISLAESVKPRKRASQVAMLAFYARLAICMVHARKSFSHSPRQQQIPLLKSEITRLKERHKTLLSSSLYSAELAEEARHLFGHADMLLSRQERKL